jgi:hypothetical protein
MSANALVGESLGDQGGENYWFTGNSLVKLPKEYSMFARTLLVLGVVLLLGGNAVAAVEAEFDDDPLPIDVSYAAMLDYQGAVYTGITGTANKDWLIHVSDYSPLVSRVDIDSTTMGSTVYFAIETDGTGNASFSVAAWSYVESVSPYAFLLSLYYDTNNIGEYDGEEDDPIQHTVWAYLFS